MSCFSKDTPISWLKWKNRSRTEKDISHLFSSLDWYFQNYSKLHFLPYFTCIIFVFPISATEQWRVKQVALNVKVELKSFIHFYSSCQTLAHFFENAYPHVHTEMIAICSVVQSIRITWICIQATNIENKNCQPPYTEHRKIYPELK